MTSPYDIKIVDEINPYVRAIKIGSGDITWIDIIEKISKKACYFSNWRLKFKRCEKSNKKNIKIY